MADMETVRIPDSAGNSIKVKKYKGRLWSDFQDESILGMEKFKSRDDDVIVVAYPKSGSHWVWEMVRFLLAGTTDLPQSEKEGGMIELAGPEKLEAEPSPRALNTHAHFELLPGDTLKRKKCKLIHLTRDPRDVAVSYYHHQVRLTTFYEYHGQWKDWLPLFMSGNLDYESWFTYTKNWEQGIKDNPDIKVHTTSYEALHEDTIREVTNLAAFLGVSKDPAFLQDVMDKTSFDHMKATKVKTVVADAKDNKTVGAPVMYRKGKVGDWKNWFTVAQSEQFDAVFEREMQGTKAYALYSHKS